jgi:hypothetical protein
LEAHCDFEEVEIDKDSDDEEEEAMPVPKPGTRRAHGGEGCDGTSRYRGVQHNTVGARKPPSSTRRTTKRGASRPL